MSKPVGVAIMRIQCEEPHEGHRHLLDYVKTHHSEMCVILGTVIGVHNDKNPLPFHIRKGMVLELYPHATVLEVVDCPTSDRIWSERIDHAISAAYGYDRTAILYGSRDSFASHYKGTRKVENIEPIEAPSGTEKRIECSETECNTKQFRIGIIWAATNRFPLLHLTADAAIWRKVDGEYEVLMGQKDIDEDYFRLIGGFAEKTDACLEDCILREAGEETGGKLSLKYPRYIASMPVPNDPRYKGTKDTIYTVFFGLEYIEGTAVATDDIKAVRWVKLENIMDVVSPIHIHLAEKLTKFLHSKN